MNVKEAEKALQVAKLDLAQAQADKRNAWVIMLAKAHVEIAEKQIEGVLRDAKVSGKALQGTGSNSETVKAGTTKGGDKGK